MEADKIAFPPKGGGEGSNHTEHLCEVRCARQRISSCGEHPLLARRYASACAMEVAQMCIGRSLSSVKNLSYCNSQASQHTETHTERERERERESEREQIRAEGQDHHFAMASPTMTGRDK